MRQQGRTGRSMVIQMVQEASRWLSLYPDFSCRKSTTFMCCQASSSYYSF
jgi:hypothetical protein